MSIDLLLATCRARLQRAVEDEFDEWLGISDLYDLFDFDRDHGDHGDHDDRMTLVTRR